MGVIIVKVFLVWEGFCRLCSNAMLGYIYADALHPSIEKKMSALRSIIIIHVKSAKQ